ncbi:MAG: tail fiber assembly protein [Plesiomonas shigelloides]
MSVYFSSSVFGFIPEHWRNDGTYSAESWPADAVLLTQEEADTYWKVSPPDGKQLGTTPEGRPCWVDIPPPSPEEQVAQADTTKYTLQREAEDAIKPLERAKSLGIATPQELALLTEWEKYSVYLMRVDTSTAPNITWPVKPAVV